MDWQRYNPRMISLVPLEPVDYLVIGHLTEDVTPSGMRLGGTAAFAALTARAFGLRVGIVTSTGEQTSLEALQGIPILKVPCSAHHYFRKPAQRCGAQASDSPAGLRYLPG